MNKNEILSEIKYLNLSLTQAQALEEIINKIKNGEII